ncbi:MAG: hypothetical protein Q9208_005081 [Pyrenodesmia sp. 3 TL-2023]
MDEKARPKPSVAYLGPAASYSHQVKQCVRLQALLYEKYLSSPYLNPFNLLDAFAAVQASLSSFAVVPFENSTYGTVVFTLDLLVDRESAYPDLLVCGEVYLPIRHNLLGHPSQRQSQGPSPEHESEKDNRAATESSLGQLPKREHDLRHISTVYSHPQALGQCEHFLSQNLHGAERRDTSSTSKAAESVAAEGPNGQAAAIGSGLAAEMYGLTILAEGIQDQDDNSTRFFVLKNAAADLKAHGPAPHQPLSTKEDGWKTLITFTLPQQPSGTLADVLQVFKDHDLNLTGIHSRPILQYAWHYAFLIEVQGKREASGHGVLNQALEEMGPKTRDWRCLGSWIDQSPQQVVSAQVRR